RGSAILQQPQSHPQQQPRNTTQRPAAARAEVEEDDVNNPLRGAVGRVAALWREVGVHRSPPRPPAAAVDCLKRLACRECSRDSGIPDMTFEYHPCHLCSAEEERVPAAVSKRLSPARGTQSRRLEIPGLDGLRVEEAAGQEEEQEAADVDSKKAATMGDAESWNGPRRSASWRFCQPKRETALRQRARTGSRMRAGCAALAAAGRGDSPRAGRRSDRAGSAETGAGGSRPLRRGRLAPNWRPLIGASADLRQQGCWTAAELYVDLESGRQAREASEASSRDLAAEAAALRRAKEFYAEQLRAAQDARQTMQDELTVLAAQAEQMGGESDHLRVRLAELEAQMLSEERQYWLDKLERIKAEIEALDFKTDQLARERQAFDKLADALREAELEAERQAAALAEREAALEAAETERATLGARVAHLDGQAAAAAVELEAARAELAESARQLDSARFDGAARGAELETTQAELAEAEVQLAASREEKRALDARINELRDNMGWVQENFSKMRADLTARAAELAHAESLRADLANELALARDNLAQQEAALTAANAARAQLAALAEESAGLRADLANLRAKLEAAVRIERHAKSSRGWRIENCTVGCQAAPRLRSSALCRI
uniref:ANK_REP_REGION domain-containing protein n=1 Tax=Macrostomum lignano TaxID=282301 RepID=A0A1I8JNG0_9PLAT